MKCVTTQLAGVSACLRATYSLSSGRVEGSVTGVSSGEGGVTGCTAAGGRGNVCAFFFFGGGVRGVIPPALNKSPM